ncbi:hypothetical protein L2E82_18135 [Cichorium intybus]|uniref:Uncharacterized protein n=1 Tax=Cichorium intybus TaxID=13427 RepID=A0ACB9F9N8_CICIN|nr:hypothetical protein L2E82_18135 [Cichorium intybus]
MGPSAFCPPSPVDCLSSSTSSPSLELSQAAMRCLQGQVVRNPHGGDGPHHHHIEGLSSVSVLIFMTTSNFLAALKSYVREDDVAVIFKMAGGFCVLMFCLEWLV